MEAASLLGADIAALCLFDETGTMANVWAVAGLAGPQVQPRRWFPVPQERPAAGCFERMEIDAAYRRSSLAEPLTAGGRRWACSPSDGATGNPLRRTSARC